MTQPLLHNIFHESAPPPSAIGITIDILAKSVSSTKAVIAKASDGKAAANEQEGISRNVASLQATDLLSSSAKYGRKSAPQV